MALTGESFNQKIIFPETFGKVLWARERRKKIRANEEAREKVAEFRR